MILDIIKWGVLALDSSLVLTSFVLAALGKYMGVLVCWGIIGLSTLPFRE